MIRVVITGSSVEGRFPYRIDTVNTRLAHPYTGLSEYPLYDGCKQLQIMGAAPDDALVGLFMEGGTGQFTRQTTVGYGANYGQWSGGMPGGRTAREMVERLNGERPAISAEPPPPPHTSPERLADTGPDFPGSSTPGQSHRKHLRGASGARRGQR